MQIEILKFGESNNPTQVKICEEYDRTKRALKKLLFDWAQRFEKIRGPFLREQVNKFENTSTDHT
jgi:hypothetical protein